MEIGLLPSTDIIKKTIEEIKWFYACCFFKS
jgi:hypothetical protein